MDKVQVESMKKCRNKLRYIFQLIKEDFLKIVGARMACSECSRTECTCTEQQLTQVVAVRGCRYS